jgi:hypothetical protein
LTPFERYLKYASTEVAARKIRFIQIARHIFYIGMLLLSFKPSKNKVVYRSVIGSTIKWKSQELKKAPK